MKFIGSFIFITAFCYFFNIVYDERWLIAYDYFIQNNFPPPLWFSFVFFTQSILWIFSPVIVLYGLVRLEVQNPLRSLYMCALFVLVAFVLQRILNEVGVFTDTTQATAYSISFTMIIVFFIIGGFHLSNERVWKYLQLPKELIMTFDNKVDIRDHPLPTKVILPYAILAFIAWDTVFAEPKVISPTGYEVKQNNFDNQYPKTLTRKKENIADGISLVTYHIPYLRNNVSDFFVDLDIKALWTPKNNEMLRIDLKGTWNGFENATKYIYKKSDIQMEFDVALEFPYDYSIEDLEYFYLKVYRQLRVHMPLSEPQAHHTFQHLANIKQPIRNLYATPQGLYLDTPEFLWILNNDLQTLRQAPGYNLFDNSLLTNSYVAIGNNKLFHGEDVQYNLDESAQVHALKTSQLGGATLAQINSSLYRAQYNWQWQAQQLEFIPRIKKISFSHDGNYAFLLTTDNDLYLCNLREFTVNLLTQFSIEIHDIIPAYDNRHIFVGGEYKSVLLYDIQEKNVFTIAGEQGPIYDMDLSIDGLYLIAGGKNKYVYIWDAYKLKLLQQNKTEDVITNVVFTPYCESSFVIGLQNGKVMASIGKKNVR